MGEKFEPLKKKKKFISALEVDKEIKRVRGMGQPRIYPRQFCINNKDMNGFVEFFVKGRCVHDCSKCNYCDILAKKVVKHNTNVEEYLKDLYKQLDSYMFR